MRETKKHWRKIVRSAGQTIGLPQALCGVGYAKYANAKRRVTCRNCIRAMGGAA
jgi:hypothetical protein